MRRLTLEEANARLAADGRWIEFGSDYVNTQTKCTATCAKGHVWKVQPSMVFIGKGCPHCAGVALISREQANKRVAERGIVFGDGYKNTHTQCTATCAEGHSWRVTPTSVIRGSGCPHCSIGYIRAPISREQANERVADRGIVFGADYAGTQKKCIATCAAGHEWQVMPNYVFQGSGCPHCAGVAPISREQANKRVVERGIVFGDDYLNTGTKCTATCSQGHIWHVTPSNAFQGTGCPHCDKIASDNDAIYIWRSVDETFQGREVYKVGITSARLDDWRIRKVARKSGRTAEIVILKTVSQARNIEKALKAYGVDPQFTGFDGCTEFRAMNADEIRKAVALIEWASAS